MFSKQFAFKALEGHELKELALIRVFIVARGDIDWLYSLHITTTELIMEFVYQYYS